MLRFPRRAAAAAISGVAALALIATGRRTGQRRRRHPRRSRRSPCRSTTARQAAPTTRTSRCVYANTTPDGTPVYIYVPEGTPLDGSAPDGGREPRSGVRSHEPDDEFAPCADATRPSYVLTQAQIDYLGDTAGQPDRRRRRGALRPDGRRRSDRAGERLAGHARLQRPGRELLRLRRDDLHGGLLRPRLHRLDRA